MPDPGATVIVMLAPAGVLVTVNSDDPPYFGGYINDNYAAVGEHLGLDRAVLAQLARNSFRASFDLEERISAHIEAVDEHEREYADAAK